MTDLEPVSRNVIAVRARYEAMKPVAGHHAYLVDQRCLPVSVITDRRFEGRIRIGDRSNAVFGHWNCNGLCGYEIKNDGFTGFAPGGTKGLWCSRITPEDTTLVIAESSIDALSYAALRGMENTRFISIGGAMNPDQPALLRSAMEKMPDSSRIVLALDNDGGGHNLANEIKPLHKALNRPNITFKVDMPPKLGQDWNDALQASIRPKRSHF